MALVAVKEQDDENIRKLQGLLQEARDTHAKLNTQLGGIAAENKKLRVELAEVKLQLGNETAKNKTIVNLEGEKLAGVQKLAARLEQENKSYKTSIAEKDTHIAKLLKNDAAQRVTPRPEQAKIAGLEKVVSSRDATIAKLTAEAQGWQRKAELADAAGSKPVEEDPSMKQIVARLQSKVTMREARSTKLSQELSDKTEELQVQRKELESMRIQLADMRKEKGIAESDRDSADQRVDKVSREIDLIDTAKVCDVGGLCL